MSKKFYEITLVNYDENNIPVIAATRWCISFKEITKEEAEEFFREEEPDLCFEAVSSIEEIERWEAIEYCDKEENIPVIHPCPFCKTFEMCKETNDWFRKNSPRHEGCRTEYKAALVTESYEKNVDYCTGTVTYGAEELNFCPVCGKKISISQN